MKGLLGGVMLAVGILVAGASGICSLAFLFSDGMGGDILGTLPIVLMVGGIPFGLGALLTVGGWALLRSEREGR